MGGMEATLKLLRWMSVFALTVFAGYGSAQQDKKLPDAPVPEPRAGDAIYAPLAVGDTPPTLKTQLETYVVVTFGPRAVVSPAFTAAFKMAFPPKGYPRIWRDGAEAYGRNYGDAIVSKVSLQTARYGTGILLHEDFRYRRSPTATGFGRLGHAIGYTFFDSGYSGHRRLALANLFGAASGGFVGISYLPDGYNDPGDGARRFASRFGGLVFSNVAREYAPEIGKFFQAIHLPFPRLPVPEWYTKDIRVARP